MCFAMARRMTDINDDDRKLPANLVWLFAAAAVGAAILAPKLIHGATSIKAMSGVIGVVFAAFGAASTLLARTGGLRAAGAFLLAGIGFTIYWYVSLHSRNSGNEGAVAAIGASVGMILVVAFGFASLVGGVGGALFGLKLRRNLKKTAAVLAQRSAR
jgi:hypothetical protein